MNGVRALQLPTALGPNRAAPELSPTRAPNVRNDKSAKTSIFVLSSEENVSFNLLQSGQGVGTANVLLISSSHQADFLDTVRQLAHPASAQDVLVLSSLLQCQLNLWGCDESSVKACYLVRETLRWVSGAPAQNSIHIYADTARGPRTPFLPPPFVKIPSHS